VRRSVVNDDGELVAEGLELSFGESPRFSGRAITALATDPDVIARTGTSVAPSRLAREYGFTDVDGNLPPEVRRMDSWSRLALHRSAALDRAVHELPG